MLKSKKKKKKEQLPEKSKNLFNTDLEIKKTKQKESKKETKEQQQFLNLSEERKFLYVAVPQFIRGEKGQ